MRLRRRIVSRALTVGLVGATAAVGASALTDGGAEVPTSPTPVTLPGSLGPLTVSGNLGGIADIASATLSRSLDNFDFFVAPGRRTGTVCLLMVDRGKPAEASAGCSSTDEIAERGAMLGFGGAFGVYVGSDGPTVRRDGVASAEIPVGGVVAFRGSSSRSIEVTSKSGNVTRISLLPPTVPTR